MRKNILRVLTMLLVCICFCTVSAKVSAPLLPHYGRAGHQICANKSQPFAEGKF